MRKLFGWLGRSLAQAAPEPPAAQPPAPLLLDFDIWPGHKVFEYDKESDTVKIAKVSKKVYANKVVYEVAVRGPQYMYISALNAKNAKKQCCKHVNNLKPTL